MAENLIITVGADASQLSAELQLAENKLRDLEKQLKKTGDVDIAKNLQREVSAVKSQIQGLQAAAATANTALSNVRVGANQAGTAVGNMSRIVQDAPFGFIAISNNLQPLFDDFARLRGETGSTGGALKALGQSLIGPAGISLAFAAVTSAITYFSMQARKAKNEMSEAEKDAKSFADSLNQAKSSALATGMQLQAYVNIAKDNTLSIDQRNEALKRANEIMGEHGDKLTLVNINTAKTTEQINTMTRALVAQAVATKYTDRAAELTIKKNNLQNQSISLNKKITDQAAESTRLLAATQGKARTSYGGTSTSVYNYIASQKKEIALKKELTTVNKDLQTTTSQITSMQLELNKATLESTKLYGELGTKEKDGNKTKKKSAKDVETLTDRYKKYLDTIQDIGRQEQLVGMSMLDDRVKTALDTAMNMIKDFNVSKDNRIVTKVYADFERFLYDLEFQRLQDILNNRKLTLAVGVDDKFLQNFTPIISNAYKQTSAFLSKENKGLEKQMQSNAEIINGIIENTFENMAVSVGEGFAALAMGGNIGDFFKGIFAVIGDGMIALGKQFIAMAIQIEVVKKFILKNPALAVAGSIALIAIGSVLKSLASKKQAFATGTTFAPGGLALVGERGPELIGLPRGSQVVPATQTSRMMGAMESVQVYGVLRGQDIYFSNKKYQQTYNRTA